MIALGILLMILTGVGWAVAGVVISTGTAKKISIPEALCYSSLLTATVAAVLLWLRPDQPTDGHTRLLALTSIAAAGILNFLHLEMMSIAMRNGPNGIAWAVIQSGMVVPFLVGTLVFGEKAGCNRFLGLGLLLVALALFARARDNSPQIQGNRKIWLLASGTDFFCVGLIQTLNNLPSYFQAADAVSTVSRTFALQAGSVCSWLLLSSFHPRKALRGFTRGALLLGMVLAVNGILTGFFIQYYGQNILAQSGFGAVASPITSASCLIWFTLYSTIFLKEKLTLPSRLALVFCIVGVVLMSLKL